MQPVLDFFRETRGWTVAEMKAAAWQWLIRDAFLADWVVAAVAIIIHSTVPGSRVKPVSR